MDEIWEEAVDGFGRKWFVRKDLENAKVGDIVKKHICLYDVYCYKVVEKFGNGDLLIQLFKNGMPIDFPTRVVMNEEESENEEG